MRSLVLALCLVASPALAAGKNWVLHTEDYPPYQTKSAKGAIEGENVKIVKELFKRAGLKVDIKMDVWEKSFDAAKKTANQGVFTAIRSPEREKLFQWVGPISVTRWVLLAKKSKNVKINELTDAFKLKIGGVANDAKTQYLEKAGATVDKVDDDSKNAKRLKDDAIDVWVTGYISGMKHAKDVGLTDLEEVYMLREDSGYIALNLDTPSKTVLDLNRIVDEMKSEGLLNATMKFKN